MLIAFQLADSVNERVAPYGLEYALLPSPMAAPIAHTFAILGMPLPNGGHLWNGSIAYQCTRDSEVYLLHGRLDGTGIKVAGEMYLLRLFHPLIRSAPSSREFAAFPAPVQPHTGSTM